VRVRDLRVGQRYALRRPGYLPVMAVVTWIENGRVDVEDEPGRTRRVKPADLLSLWEPHAAALARAEAVRWNPAGEPWYEWVSLTYAGDKVATATDDDFGVTVHMICAQAERFAAFLAARRS
jgi:hypothetical protein